MPNYSKAIIIGHITRDIETKYNGEGLCIASLGIAINEKRKGKEEASFFDVKAFGKTAENIAKFFTKGKPILVEGRLTQERWEKDGQKRSKVVIIADTFAFVGGNKGEGNSAEPKIRDEDVPAASTKPDAHDDVPF